eukprot:247377_1
MSGKYFLIKVQPLNILNQKELIKIMNIFLAEDNKNNEINKLEMECIKFNEYNCEYSNVIIYNNTTQIMTNGNGKCEWIWFSTNNGWKNGKHKFNVLCAGVSITHKTGNIIGLIGVTNYKLIKNKNIFNLNECMYDIDWDESDNESES